MPKVLVADKISPTGVALLKAQPGYEVVEAYGSTPEQVLSLVADVDAILVRSETQITREVLAAAHRLVCVGRAGVGVDNIDVDAATERGVIVMNTPSGNTIATAELTFTHLLSLARPVPEAVQSMREGKWDRKSLSGSELFGKTLGVLGLGKLGQRVAGVAKALGMKVIAWSQKLTPEKAKEAGVDYVNKEYLFAKSDIVSIHVVLSDRTRGIVGAKELGLMKKTAYLVNTARAPIVDGKALMAALQSKSIAGAGLDVFEVEPLPLDHPLRKMDNVVITPHLGYVSEQNYRKMYPDIVEDIRAWLDGKPVRVVTGGY